MSALIARIVVGGCGPRGFREYAAGQTPVENAGALSLARAASNGSAEALARLCELVEAELPSRSSRGTYFRFARESYASFCEANELTAGPRGPLSPEVEGSLRASLGAMVRAGSR